jgi:hypothetical protein
MDSFFSRLKYYGIGFGIGLIFVIFFFQNRGCSWLPDNRVKNSILDRVLVLPESEAQQLKKFGLTKKDLTLVLNDGEVLFDESKKEGDPKVYVVEKEIPSHGKMKFFFSLAKESFISEIHFSKKNALKIKNTTDGFGELIYFPNDDNLVFPDSSKNVTCQQDALGLINPKDILKYLKKSGKIDYSKSHLQATPKPEHFLVFTDEKGREIGANVIWYKNKLNITNFVIPFKNSCE